MIARVFGGLLLSAAVLAVAIYYVLEPYLAGAR